MKSKKSLLKEIAEKLFEAEEVKKQSGEDSLDSQVDEYLTSYESEAKSSKNEGKSYSLLARHFIFEAEDETEKDEDKSKKSSKTLSLEDIDIKSFVSSVVRLIENYDSLLEVKNTILRRAYNRLAEMYDQEVVDTFNEELLEAYGIEIGKSKSEIEDDFVAPKAAAAGPMSGGGA